MTVHTPLSPCELAAGKREALVLIRLDVVQEVCIVGDVPGGRVVADNVPVVVAIAVALGCGASHARGADPDELRKVPNGLEVARVARVRG